MDSSPPTKTTEPVLPVAGTKRPAPSLLPPFEPLSSSPGFPPRPLKRQARAGSVGSSNGARKYPTPVPTSSTGILSSSPPRTNGTGAGTARQHPQHHQHGQSRQQQTLPPARQDHALSQARPGLTRTQSTVSERAPLASLPAVELNENGETLLMGRSSNSSHYQLSGNRLVSRIHVKARYIPASAPLEPNKVEIVCNGWNGLKLHCQGRTWELLKGDSFTSETEGTEIMVDVNDARVMIQWPKQRAGREPVSSLSEASWDDSPRSQVRGGAGATPTSGLLQSSPLRRSGRVGTPESPTPGATSSSQRLQSLLPGSDSGEIRIFEDPSADEAQLPPQGEEGAGHSFMTEVTNSFSSDLSDPDELENEYEDPDEENDPIVHSFGPFGANISNRLASITASSPKQKSSLHGSPKRAQQPAYLSASTNQSRPAHFLASATTSASHAAPLDDEDVERQREEEEAPATPPPAFDTDNPTVKNHVINQLAFSRLSSTPLSTIMVNLPAEEKHGLVKEHLRAIIEATGCVGIIARQGKDAAGKALESEYYYMPEADDDENRRLAVTDGLRKPSLRACRKQHKQYYWKRPKTP